MSAILAGVTPSLVGNLLTNILLITHTVDSGNSELGFVTNFVY